ncbi:MAG: GAF domain-containing protein [Candidatus Eremiobacteraeota bacterium]|nr:GAF domain-containing protein [Candidatus Eremiobacteraeota bacterium]
MEGKKANQVIDSLTLLCARGQELSSTDDLQTLLNRVIDTVIEICHTEAVFIALATDEKVIYYKVTGSGGNGEIKKLRLDENITQRIRETDGPVIVNNIPVDSDDYRSLDDISGVRTKKLMRIHIYWEKNVIGVIQVVNKENDEDFTEQDLEYLTILSNQTGSSLHIATMMEKLHNFFINMLEIMMMATETLGSQQGHSVRVARIATKIAREMGVSQKEYKNIYYASLIHDIGQIKVARDQIVGGERLIPVLGAEMLRPIKMLNSIAEIVEDCHERWDGSGFPKSLKGDEIPLGAHIVGFAEEYVEWLEEESYRKQYDPYFQDEFFRRITKTHNPKVVEAFKAVRRKERERPDSFIEV